MKAFICFVIEKIQSGKAKWDGGEKQGQQMKTLEEVIWVFKSCRAGCQALAYYVQNESDSTATL